MGQLLMTEVLRAFTPGPFPLCMMKHGCARYTELLNAVKDSKLQLLNIFHQR